MTTDSLIALAYFPEIAAARDEAARQRAEEREQQRLAIERAQAQALEERFDLWDAAQAMATVAPPQPQAVPVRTEAERRARTEEIRREYEAAARRKVFG